MPGLRDPQVATLMRIPQPTRRFRMVDRHATRRRLTANVANSRTLPPAVKLRGQPPTHVLVPGRPILTTPRTHLLVFRRPKNRVTDRACQRRLDATESLPIPNPRPLTNTSPNLRPRQPQTLNSRLRLPTLPLSNGNLGTTTNRAVMVKPAKLIPRLLNPAPRTHPQTVTHHECVVTPSPDSTTSSLFAAETGENVWRFCRRLKA
jgi:hypothetical protein